MADQPIPQHQMASIEETHVFFDQMASRSNGRISKRWEHLVFVMMILIKDTESSRRLKISLTQMCKDKYLFYINSTMRMKKIWNEFEPIFEFYFLFVLYHNKLNC